MAKRGIMKGIDGQVIIITPGTMNLDEAETDPQGFFSDMSRRFDGQFVGVLEDSEIQIPMIRRDAARWDGSKIIDDKKVTTETEVMAAYNWKRKILARDGNPITQRDRIIHSGMIAELGQDEVDSLVDDWRKSNVAPQESRFDPLPTKKPAPIPKDFLGGR